MRLLGVLVVGGMVATCGPKPPMTSLPVETPAPTPVAAGPAIAAHYDGLWAGTASTSPMGKKPYALFFARDGAKLICETPTELSDEPLPPGAYQRFVFEDAETGGTLAYTTALGARGTGEGVLKLDPARSGPAVWHYTADPSTPRYLELRFEKVDARTLKFQTFLGGTLHVEVSLAPWSEADEVTRTGQ